MNKKGINFIKYKIQILALWSYILFSGNEFIIFQSFAQEQLYPKSIYHKRLRPDSLAFKELNYIEFDENETEDEETSYTTKTNPILRGNADVLVKNSAFIFNGSGFRFRGYDFRENQLYLNGMPIRNLERKYPGYNYFFGITELLYSKTIERGNNSTTFTPGGLGVFTNFSVNAHEFNPKLRLRYSSANRSYRHRVSLNYHSGIGKSKWAISNILTGRFGKGYFDGTFLNSIGGYLGLSKIIDNHSLSLNILGGLLHNARPSATLLETRALANSSRYNPLWGLDHNKERNSRIQSLYQLYSQFSHTWRINTNAELKNNLSFTINSQVNSSFDWFDGTNPSPEYYRKLPSFYQLKNQQSVADLLKTFLKDNHNALQVDFAKIRDIHKNVQNNSEDNSGIRAHYIIAERVVNRQQIAISSTYSRKFSSFSLYLGLFSAGEKSNNFMRVGDLLGANYWLDVNNFFPTDLLHESYDENPEQLVQNNLLSPNRKVKTGEKYRYNYDLFLLNNQLWVQGILSLGKIELHLGLSMDHDLYFRQGHTKNGLFPNNSLGRSQINNFLSHQQKIGLSYKVNGKNHIYINALHNSQAPLAENLFTAAYLNNIITDKSKLTHNYNIETGYQHRSELLALHIDFFLTHSRNVRHIYRFYNDEFLSFGQYSLPNIHKLYYGTELGAEIQLPLHLNLSLITSIGNYRYINNPTAIITADNSPNISQTETIYFKNLPLEGSSQNAYAVSLFYYDPNFWYVGIHNVITHNQYAYMNPVRRSLPAIIDINPNKDQAKINEIFQPLKLPLQYFLNLTGGYSKRLKFKFSNKDNYGYLSFYLNVQNLLNRQNIISNAFEQLRYDFRRQNPNTFPARYMFAMGINYSLSVAFSF